MANIKISEINYIYKTHVAYALIMYFGTENIKSRRRKKKEKN